ncbi:hypothetical protein HYW76_01295 [Candidatus Pacearchaeota archaeon]|nr:hypothetical protein [Candidatus Pacearchaeota archaeon]
MDNIVTDNFYELAEKYGNQGEDADVAMGLRPSGIIHLGNIATLSLASLLARKIGPHLSRVNMTICDIDLPSSTDFDVKTKGFVRYFRELPDKSECHPNMLDHARDAVQNFAGGLEKELKIRINIQNLTKVQKEKTFRDGLKRVLDVDDKNFMRYLLPQIPDDCVLVYPICRHCSTSNCKPSFYSRGEGVLVTSCSNPDCLQFGKERKVEVADLKEDLAVHYFIDPLRDRTVEPKSRIHVFGGDYKETHGGKIPKIEKILKVMEIAGIGDVPDILIGPTFYSRDGTKMSKSVGNGLTVDKLRAHFKEDYVKNILGLMNHLTAKGFKQIDYQIVDDYLFAR